MGEEEYRTAWQGGLVPFEDGASGHVWEPSIDRWQDDHIYADQAGFFAGFPVAMTRWQIAPDQRFTWPVHCYAMVGVGRNLSPDTGSGAELYTVIGHAPRHLDRNIALVGRVIEGMQHLSSLPRGTGPLGFYETSQERTIITGIRLSSELPVADQPRFEYLSTDSESFARYADARANRRDPFFIRPAGGADICNIPVPVRRVPG
jgi:peptidylprolyl isomerase